MIVGRSCRPFASASMGVAEVPGMPAVSSVMRAVEFGAMTRLAASSMSFKRRASDAVTAARSAAIPFALSRLERSSTSEHAVSSRGVTMARRSERCFM